MSTINSNVQTLANRFERFNRSLITFVEQCPAADWQKVTTAEGWPVGVTAHHIGATHYPLIAWVQLLVEGKPVPAVTMAMVNQANAQHAQAHGNCTQAEVIQMLDRDGDKALAYLLTLGDEDLNRQGYVTVFETTMSAGQLFATAFIDYANAHFESMKAAVSDEKTNAQTSTEAIKALLYRLNDEIMNEGKLQVIDEIFTQDHVHHNAMNNENVYGPEGVKKAAAVFCTFLPDVHIIVNSMIVEGNMAATHWTILGTPQGEVDETMLVSQKVTWSGASFFRIRDGKICERWAYGDEPKPVE